MVRTVTNKPCSGAANNGSPCQTTATRQLDVAILTHNGRQCSHEDQHNTPWVCDKCFRCPMRCAQRDSQPHKKCAHGPIPRCARRLAAYHLGEFEFNFTHLTQSEESDITADGGVDKEPSPRRARARVSEAAAASGARPMLTPLNHRCGVAVSGRKRGRPGSASSLVHTRPAQRARMCGCGQGVEISIGTVASERRAEPAGATRTAIDDAGLALLEDAELGEESGALDSSGEKDVGLFSWDDSTLLHPMLDWLSYETAIPDVDGSGASGFADADLSTLLASLDRGVPTLSQEPMPDASFLDDFDMDLLDDVPVECDV